MNLKHLTLLVFFLAVYAKDENSLSHGFGEDIEWVSWDSALELSQQQNKPVFMLIHKTWCGACKALKKNFNTSTKKKEIVELSKKFIMVNLEDDEEPEDEKYAPDGAYIPRLFFLDKNGDLLEVDNKKNYPNNAYYFPQAVDVLKAMKRALIEFGGEVEESKEKTAEKVDAKEEEKEETKKEKEEKESESKKEKSEEKPKEEEVKKSKKEEKEKKDEPKKEKAKEEKKKEKGGEKKEEKADSKKQEQKKEKEGQKKEKKEKSEKTKGKKTEL